MRIQTFTGANLVAAMAEVRAALGDDAVIVSTYESRRGRGVEITAALDEQREDDALAAALATEEDLPPPSALAIALTAQGIPAALAQRLERAADAHAGESAEVALAAALDATFGFTALPQRQPKPVMLVGPPGMGKTVTLVKIAARAVIAGSRVRLISTDTVRAGAFAQLEAFAQLLDQPLYRADSEKDLAAALAAPEPSDLILIDTPGTNPFAPAEMADLRRFLDVAPVEATLVLRAGLDGEDAADTAQAFAALGARRLHMTQLDVARRLGALLGAAQAGRLAFAEVSATPFIADGLSALSPVSLARLLLRPSGASAATARTAS